MNKTIIFVGALPHQGEPPLGGGEQGNSRTVGILNTTSYSVKIIRRLRSNRNMPRIIQITTYPIRVIVLLLKLVAALIGSNPKETIVHYVGFYIPVNIKVDIIALKIIKLFKFKVIYEIRGAGIVDYNNDKSEKNRECFNCVLRNADYIFSQGMDNKVLADRVCPEKEFFYYPNYVEDEFLPQQIAKRTNDKYKLIYFGRLEEGKNTLMIVDIFSQLRRKYENVFLTLVGNGENDYMEELMKKIKLLPHGSCECLKGVQHSDLKSILEKHHFFIFPTEREGHSNALTEAMSMGVVPIVSNRGFNASVLNDNNLVVDNLNPTAFAFKVSSIIDGNKWKDYSMSVHQRVLDNYSYSIVSSKLKSEYEKLFNLI